MTDVWYTCPFVPPEWIAAHGLRPRRMHLAAPAGGGGPVAAEGMCPYADAFVTRAAAAGPDDLVIATTLCDQMRRAPEAVGADPDRLILLHVPATWQTAAAGRLYREELQRLGAFLVRHGDRAPSPAHLAEVMCAWDDARRALRDARPALGARDFAEAWASLDPAAPPAASSPVRPPRAGPAVAVIGGPILRDSLWLLDLIEQAGARVVLLAVEGAELTAPAPLNRRRLRDDPLAELADAYFGHIPHPARRPNSRLHEYLQAEMTLREVRGAILVRWVWCDVWHAETQRIKQWAPCPVVDLDLTDDSACRARAQTRIQSLMEMLA